MRMTPRVPLFDRLPEIYRVRDAEQAPPDQLKAYLDAIESAFAAVHVNVEQLYQDLFIDTSGAGRAPSARSSAWRRT
jgi:hypothetical protein